MSRGIGLKANDLGKLLGYKMNFSKMVEDEDDDEQINI